MQAKILNNYRQLSSLRNVKKAIKFNQIDSKEHWEIIMIRAQYEAQ